MLTTSQDLTEYFTNDFIIETYNNKALPLSQGMDATGYTLKQLITDTNTFYNYLLAAYNSNSFSYYKTDGSTGTLTVFTTVDDKTYILNCLNDSYKKIKEVLHEMKDDDADTILETMKSLVYQYCYRVIIDYVNNDLLETSVQDYWTACGQ